MLPRPCGRAKLRKGRTSMLDVDFMRTGSTTKVLKARQRVKPSGQPASASNWLALTLQLVIPAVLIFAWGFCIRFTRIDLLLTATHQKVLLAVIQTIADGSLLRHIWASLVH